MKRTAYRILFYLLAAVALSACNAPLAPLPSATAAATSTAQPQDLPTGAPDPTDPPAPTDTPSGATQPTTAPLPGEDVGLLLAQAIEARDFAKLRALMGDRFSISTFNQSLYEYPSDEALDKLRQGVLAEGSTPAVRWGTDIAALLNGADPLAQWGPVASPVRAMHVMGLGPKATEEAVLVIARDNSTARFYWHGILLAPDGYFHTQKPSG